MFAEAVWWMKDRMKILVDFGSNRENPSAKFWYRGKPWDQEVDNRRHSIDFGDDGPPHLDWEGINEKCGGMYAVNSKRRMRIRIRGYRKVWAETDSMLRKGYTRAHKTEDNHTRPYHFRRSTSILRERTLILRCPASSLDVSDRIDECMIGRNWSIHLDLLSIDS